VNVLYLSRSVGLEICNKKADFTVILGLLVIAGDASKPKAWSKYALDSSAYKKEHEGLKDNELREEKRKPEKEKKKDCKVQELVDKVLWLC
jgi:hypothetical protein